MSELILPKEYVNPLLEANLNAFFLRYPYERSRLETLLRQPVENRAVAQIELPPVPSKPPLRVVLLAGIGSPSFLATFFNDPTVREETYQIFVVENNLDFLRFCFQYSNLTQVITQKKFEWLFMHGEESIKPALFRILKREEIAAMMRSVYVLETHVEQPPEISSFYKKLPQIYDETCQHVMHNFGRIGDSLEGVKATLMNKLTILDNPGIHDLKGSCKGIPALICGAGPSLEAELELIKANNDKFVVIAADAALKPLKAAGIRVDYVTSIERLNDYQKPFFEGLDAGETELVAFPVLQPDVVKLYNGPIRVCYRNYSYFAYFEKNWPKGILKCGGSTSHLAVRLADWMGCSKMFLIGTDSAYEKHPTEDLYRSHCGGTGYEEWGSFVPLETFNQKRMHMPAIEAEANSGQKVMTNLTYYQWVKEYAEELSEIGHRMPIINCSSKGLKIVGINYKALSDIVPQLLSFELPKAARPKPVCHRAFDHKTILQNFKIWFNLSQQAISECERLISLATISQEEFDALLYVYNYKVAVDPLFVAFVVQCCAKEFFEIENKWWSFDKRWEVDIKEKIAVTKEKFQLFESVLSQVIAIFEEAKKHV